MSFLLAVNAQETVLPTKPHIGVSYIKNATIHLGNGKVLENGTIKIKDGKIEEVGTNIVVPGGADVKDATGQHVYPGLILATSSLGLGEVNAVRATQDVSKIILRC